MHSARGSNYSEEGMRQTVGTYGETKQMHEDLKSGERPTRYRTMRHDCKNGERCFEDIYRCRLGILDHLFPGMNGLTDVDGLCCINGHLLFIEWKTSGECKGKQLEALEVLARIGTVIIGYGDPTTMIPRRFDVSLRGGKFSSYSGPDAASRFDDVIKQWSEWAHSQKVKLAD